MKYWDDFQTKWGFGDGDSVPPDAHLLRQVYVGELNSLLQKRKSSVRLLAWDRPGLHNPLLIVRVPAAMVRDVPLKQLTLGQWNHGWQPEGDWQEPPTDAAYDAAIDEAQLMELDSMIVTRVTRRRKAA